MKRIAAITTPIALAIAGVFMVVPSSHGLLAAPESSFIAYFPMLIQGSQTFPTSPVVTVTSTPLPGTPHPTSTPATAPPLATPESRHGEVVFQLATFGGISIDRHLGDIPSQTPRFTLLEDGHYIRIVEGYDADVDRFTAERREGTLSDAEQGEFVRRLLEDVEYFDLPTDPPNLMCVIDGPMDYLYMRDGDREHRMKIYGLTGYGRYPDLRCPTAWVSDDRLIRFAEFVDAFTERMTADEAPLAFDRITLVAKQRDVWREDPPAPMWPFGPAIRLADMPGDDEWWREMQLEGELAREIARAIEENSVWDSNLARFTEDGLTFDLGARIEFAGWDTYRK